ncbi:MAG: hypothetical protein IPL60_10480 [Ardenticatenia bacterium]|nr:hypothetical protein [Ardenticatenia bacterium]
MLDRTLAPALARWGPEEVRLWTRPAARGTSCWRASTASSRPCAARPDLTASEAARHVLPRVVGIDLNDYACALARARLLMAALEASGSRDLHDAHDLHPQVFWADGLDQPEREENPASRQLDLFGAAVAAGEPDLPIATLSRPEVRARLAPLLTAGFHVVVANRLTSRSATSGPRPTTRRRWGAGAVCVGHGHVRWSAHSSNAASSWRCTTARWG